MREQNSTHEYADAARYDDEYGCYDGDFDFFLNLLGTFEKQLCHILDLGCGTGRLTFKLAEKGHHTIGLDNSLEMLNLARKKDTFGRIQWIQDDLLTFDLGRSFDLIAMTGNTFQAFLTPTDQQRMLSCIKRHMKPGSLFAFNTRNPRPQDLYTTDIFEKWHTFKDREGTTVNVFGRQSYDPKAHLMTYETKRQYPNFDILSPLQIRFTPYNVLAALLESCGFTLMNIYGDFNNNPFIEDSASIICVCST